MKRVFDYGKLDVKKPKLHKILRVLAISLVTLSIFGYIVTGEDKSTNLEAVVGGLLHDMDELKKEHNAPLELRKSVVEILTTRETSVVNMEKKTVDFIKSYGYGSGTVVRVDKDSFVVLTALHVVVAGEGKVTEIALDVDGKKFTNVTIINENNKNDLAVLLVEGVTRVNPVKIAKRVPEVGKTVWFVANPLQIDRLINKGIISKYRSNTRMITSTAAISGASGGMVVNLDHELVGVVSGVLIADLPLNNLIKMSVHHPLVYNDIIRVNAIHAILKGIL